MEGLETFEQVVSIDFRNNSQMRSEMEQGIKKVSSQFGDEASKLANEMLLVQKEVEYVKRQAHRQFAALKLLRSLKDERKVLFDLTDDTAPVLSDTRAMSFFNRVTY